jgi:hypothetical protein
MSKLPDFEVMYNFVIVQIVNTFYYRESYSSNTWSIKKNKITMKREVYQISNEVMNKKTKSINIINKYN